MLSSITPLGERGRNNRFATAASFFIAGSLLGGVATGLLAGGAGQLVMPDPTVGAGVVATLAIVGAALDARVGGLRLPTIKRQVDENWLNRYRGWVYGLGFGVQLGTGLATIVSSTAVYLMFVAAFLTSSAFAGALIGGVFGLVRGASILLARRIRTPDDLRRFHRRLADNATRSTRVGVATQGLIGAAGLLVIGVLH